MTGSGHKAEAMEISQAVARFDSEEALKKLRHLACSLGILMVN
jgi:hypothetical protein